MREITDKFIPLSIKDKARIKDNANVFIVMQKKLKNYYKDLNIELENVTLQKIILIITFCIILDRYSNKSLEEEIKKIKDKNNNSPVCLRTKLLNYFYQPLNKSPRKRIYCTNHIYSYLENDLLLDLYHDLSSIILDVNSFVEILPYILEVFEYEMQEANLSRDNKKKKSKGIYYTPDDVANYIVQKTVKRALNDLLNNRNSNKIEEIKIIDPSCGTGIFLKLALRELLGFYELITKHDQSNNKLNSPLEFCLRNNIYGVDKSATAINSSIFILLISAIDELRVSELSPYELWTLASLNIKSGDSTLGSTYPPNNLMDELMNLRVELKNGILFSDMWEENNISYQRKKSTLLEKDFLFDYKLEFPEVFNGKGKGFSCIVGNPPYFRLEDNREFKYQEKNYTSAALSRDSNIYTLFVENMKLLSSPYHSYSGLVIPLSISYSGGKSNTALREMIKNDFASWDLIHFDRSPDSLFGDDIKTRNCIIFRSINQKGKTISTSPLLRWNSRNRHQLFENISVVDISKFEIKDYIPKIGLDIEKISLQVLEEGQKSFFEMVIDIPKKDLIKDKENAIYLYSTAYNWIPTFRDIPKSFDKDGNIIITDSLWGVKAEDEIAANFIYALLASKLFYWYWVVRGDLFHLPKKFLKTIKVHKDQFNKEDYIFISNLGKELWTNLQLYPIKKVNAGKTIGNYNPLPCQDIIDKIDSVLNQSLNLPQSFNLFLKEWHSNLIRAGRTEYKNASYIDPEHILMEV